MKKAIWATATAAAVLVSGSVVSAADLSAPMYTKAPPYAAQVTLWDGFYIGGQVGYQFSHVRQTEFGTGGGAATGLAQSWDPDGVTGGGHIGYNWQFSGPFVLGIEGDFEGSGVSGNAPGVGGVGTAFDQRWQASVRGRLGYAVGNALLYVTGGAAWTDVRTRYSFAGAASLPGDSFTGTVDGYTIGAGAEWMFAPAWSARVEYRYADFGRFTDVTPASLGPFDYRNRFDTHTVRVGVSYHFGGGPVVARY